MFFELAQADMAFITEKDQVEVINDDKYNGFLINLIDFPELPVHFYDPLPTLCVTDTRHDEPTPPSPRSLQGVRVPGRRVGGIEAAAVSRLGQEGD